MPDSQYIKDEKKLDEMRRKLTQIYTRADKELGEKWKAYMDKGTKRCNELRMAIREAKTPEERAKAKEAYEGYLTQYTLQNARFKDLTEQYAKQLSNVNETAVKYINNQLPGIYTSNYNFTAGSMLDNGAIGYSWSTIDENTVKHLIVDGETILPYKKIDTRKDVRWNTEKVNSEVLQGILQGESIDKIKKRLSTVVGMNKDSAYRNARTAVTSAENKGRIDMMKRAEDDGVISHKIWMSAHDGHTRKAHLQLDGQEQPREDPFTSILGEIMYPGDPDADPANVYNCRCTLTYKIIGFGRPKPEQQPAQEAEQAAQPKAFESEKLKAAMSESDYNNFKELVENSETKKLYDKYADSCRDITESDRGVYRGDTVNFNYDYEKYAGISRYSTLAHEMGHMFDSHMRDDAELEYKEADAINAVLNKVYPNMPFAPILKRTPSQSDGFLKALRTDMEAIEPRLTMVAREMKATNKLINASAGVQDALDGFFKTRDKGLLGWGHGNKYYNRMYNSRIAGNDVEKEFKATLKELGFNVRTQQKAKDISRHYEAASEAWANIASAVTVGGDELIAVEKYMPKALDEFKRIVRNMK